MFPLVKFPHRHNANGTHDSICTECFATVATASDESRLAEHESAHVCNAVDLCRISQCRPNLYAGPTDFWLRYKRMLNGRDLPLL